MKVLQLTSHFSPNIGGVETHLGDLIKALIEKGISVGVLTYQPLTTKAQWKTYESKKNFFVIRLPWVAGGFYKFVNIPMLEFLYLFPGIFIITPFVLIFQNPDVIHAHGLVAGFVGIVWGKLFQKKVIVSLHSIYHFPKKGIYRNTVIWLFLKVDLVLCLSKQSQKEIISLGIPKKKVRVFTYWINQKLFQRVSHAKEKLDLSKRFVVLFVGRLVAEKGLKQLLEAANGFPSDTTLLIVGTGPMEQQVKSAENGKAIIYAGKILQKDLSLYYSSADIVIVPSTHEEGFGRVILEALSCGTVVVAAKRGGIVEALPPQVGYLIEISPKNIKKVVEYCHNHTVELEDKSKQARFFAQKHYSEKNAEIIIHAYEKD